MDNTNLEVKLANLERSCEFDADWHVVTDLAEDDDALLGVQLSSVSRAASQAGTAFKIGSLDLLCSWSKGLGMTLRRTENGWSMASWSRVSAWADLNEDWPDWIPETPSLPILPQKNEILQSLCNLRQVYWYGMRDHRTNTWEQQSHYPAEETPNLQKASMAALQLDMLMKSSGLPRGRMAAVFSTGILWMWVNRQDDFLVLASERELTVRTMGQIQMLGEGFLLL